ncbi:hypothetical protein [Conexibacter sp. SYSU D00693]|uniref:hypothetical protein n=1 Tax=Conexibacter sp. SYSU D00693 TaxID=2812560 RepID=UPI00196A7BD1|nr:hypothetical protein [Conexibacter sp. SYSU D00693]
MDDLLKRVADAGLHVTAAEEALDAGERQSAEDALDAADAELTALRERWPAMGAAERTVVGRTAGPVRARLDAARKRLPPVRAVSQAPVEVDPEQDEAPEDDGPPPAA